MSIALIIILAILGYIISVLLCLLYPYIEYRKHCIHLPRTIGGFIDYMGAGGDSLWISVAFLPILNIVFMALVFSIGIMVWLMQIYNKFIRNIRI